MSASPRAGSLPRIGGALALDFCNSASGRGTAHFVENLFDFEDLLRWSVAQELLTAEAAADLERRLTPDERAAAFARAMVARGLLNRVFDAVARRETVAREDLAELATAAGEISRTGTLVPEGAGYAWRFEPVEAGADGPLRPIVRSAVEVLTRRDLARVKFCPGEGCGWVFLDQTKNASRVWCEMEVCGTRAKLKKRAAKRARGFGQVSAAE